MGPAVAEMHERQQAKVTELMDVFDSVHTKEFPPSDEYSPIIEEIDELCKAKRARYLKEWEFPYADKGPLYRAVVLSEDQRKLAALRGHFPLFKPRDDSEDQSEPSTP